MSEYDIRSSIVKTVDYILQTRYVSLDVERELLKIRDEALDAETDDELREIFSRLVRISIGISSDGRRTQHTSQSA